MAGENRKRLEELPIFLQPKLRLFLSVDLVGSTASKQRARFPIREPKKLWAEGMAPPWLSPIANFFGAFQEAFAREWRLFKSQIAKDLAIEVKIDPSFWKANGDELIFVKELYDRKEILGCIDAWLKALKSVRSKLVVSGLDLKATAWTAGFPVTNSELVFQVHPAALEGPPEDDPRLQQFYLLEKWHTDPTSQDSLMMDYIGPSVDTGFRLASHSSPRHFVISVDVAYLLVTAQLPEKEVIKVPPIFFGGKEVLKGVLGGKPYPILWIDTMSDSKIAKAEDHISGITRCDDGAIRAYARAFYEDNATLMVVPFIFREPDTQYPEFPENYILALEHLHQKWLDEKTRSHKETEIESADDDEDAPGTLSEFESEKKEKEIIAKLIKSRSSQK